MVNNAAILNLVGRTPLVELPAFGDAAGAKIFVKLEYLNPSGSLKDRIALKMIVDAEVSGRLAPGNTILESSTGNTGIAIAFAASVKGYRVVIYETTPGNIGAEKIKMMAAYGAEVRSLPPNQPVKFREGSVAGAEVELPGRQACLDLEKTGHEFWWARQFSNPSNVLAHHETGEEILRQMQGQVDVFVASIGTGGTLKGVAEVLKQANPSTKIVGIQPAASMQRITPGEPYPASDIDGGIISQMVLIPSLIDKIVEVKDEDAVHMTHQLWARGLFAGVSSGANVLVALREARAMRSGNIVTVLADSGNRYLTEEHFVT